MTEQEKAVADALRDIAAGAGNSAGAQHQQTTDQQNQTQTGGDQR